MSDPTAAPPKAQLRAKSIALIGLMGAGKSTIGRRLAQSLDMPFSDADAEIEAAAGCSIAEIFARHGEEDFRRGEGKVMERLLAGPPTIIATGGGAFMNPEIRRLIATRAISVWLRADLDLLLDRVLKRDTRPLLKEGDPRQIMARLQKEREPVYATANIIVDSIDGPHDGVVKAVIKALQNHYHQQNG